MFKVPRYTATNYRQIIFKQYSPLDTLEWINFNKILNYLTNDNIKQNANLDARRMGVNNPQEIVQSKLLLPTLWCSDYFFWNVGEGTHHGIDIILPKNTPIPAFDAGIVTKIKKRDGNKKNEGNCVVIKGPNCYWSYSHCEKINVKIGDYIKRGEIIATVGSTGNSTQYHLHLQCDKFNSPFQPYYNNELNIEEIKKYTINPIEELKKILPNTTLFYDMPLDKKYSKSIIFLSKLGIIKGHGYYVEPLNFLKRYEFALIIYRLLQKETKLTKGLSKIESESINYTDINKLDDEAKKSLLVLQRYKIMNGYQNKFEPYKDIKGQEALAVLGRLFFGLKDDNYGHWYKIYINKFINEKIIPEDWEFIGLPVLRQEIFRILGKLLDKTIYKV